MTIRVIDFETTGLPDDQVKGICEYGYVDVSTDKPIIGYTAELVNPGHPIPPETRAVHHISDEDVKDAISPDKALSKLMAGMELGDKFAAHNAPFEQSFFGGGSLEWICTLKCAKHLWPEAPGHSNQVLRYWLNLDEQMESELAMPPHRAGPDAYVTGFLLQKMLEEKSAEELVKLTTAPVLLVHVTFGKHRGKRWSEVPRDYLRWIVNKSEFGADEKHTAKHYLGEA